MEDFFKKVYTENIWERGSGPGSYPENTIAYREYLQKFLAEHHIKSVVDIGCGDWQFSRLIDWTGIDYLGIDCVEDVIAGNQAQFSAPNIRFLHDNAAAMSEIPWADLAIIKDVLQHLTIKTICELLNRLPCYRYILFTNSDTGENTDLHADGHFRPLNLALPPFSLELETVLRWQPEVHDSKATQLWKYVETAEDLAATQ
ncbi:MAG: SAM-dependent methyltransferase [Akkermansiaceae bacterium]|nr:SAM-dependent methyltransferase [Akkermansiaceae bacterium]